MKKGMTWATVIVLFFLVISLSVNLIAQAGWECDSGECPEVCRPPCYGWNCFTVTECCGYCTDEELEILCICCIQCLEPF